MKKPEKNHDHTDEKKSVDESSDRSRLASDIQNFDSQSDLNQIINDQDMTNERDITELDENMGAVSHSLEPLEDEPAEFMRGEIDVVEQMNRTTRAMEDAIEESTGRKAHIKSDTYRR